MPTGVAVGVDLGGTRVRLVATGSAGWSRRVETRAPSLADLPGFLRRLWRQWGLSRQDVDALVVGAKGVWTAGERRRQEQRLRGLARRIRVISDAEAAILGTRGDRAQVLVLAGTGSIVVGWDLERGRGRAGGLGPLLGDEGSAFWIGREWLRRSVGSSEGLGRARKLARSPHAVARIAALAPGVLRKARAGHRGAREIVAAAQRHLATLARRVVRGLRLRQPVSVFWAGSLMANPAFRAGVWRTLRRQGVRTRVMVPARSPVSAAHAWARQLAGGNPP